MNTYILSTERRNFKTFWKGRKLCNWFGQLLLVWTIEHETEHDIDIAYGVCMH